MVAYCTRVPKWFLICLGPRFLLALVYPQCCTYLTCPSHQQCVRALHTAVCSDTRTHLHLTASCATGVILGQHHLSSGLEFFPLLLLLLFIFFVGRNVYCAFQKEQKKVSQLFLLPLLVLIFLKHLIYRYRLIYFLCQCLGVLLWLYPCRLTVYP